jgi:hypothetical protein
MPHTVEPEEGFKHQQNATLTALASWVVGNVDAWEDYRNANFKDNWDMYYRQWRSVWNKGDQERGSERSRLISPALGQAIEATTAELEEAIFGNRERWIDVEDDVIEELTASVPKDQRQDGQFFDNAPPELLESAEDMFLMRDLLLEDMDREGFKEAVSEILLNAAIYGTGIGKLLVEEEKEKLFVRKEVKGGKAEASFEEKEVAKVRLRPIMPEEFAIDPSARNVNEALGCAHVTIVPRHTVIQKQVSGSFFDVPVDSIEDDIDVGAKGESKSHMPNDRIKLTEYHGHVPISLLPPVDENGDIMDSDEVPEIDEDDLVEAIVTIANDGTVLKATENPYTFKDRSFLAFQLDTVPNRFWGRGIAEKGFNSQSALNAELRGRADAMALSIHPMMAIDATRIPRGGDMTIAPGKTILTNGDPRTALLPFTFGQVSPQSFPQSADLERMIQMGTGAMDSATPTDQNPRNNTFGGMSMIASGSVKRSKRYLRNIERNFLKPMITKTAWRYMQFDSERYPIVDAKFKPLGALGMMAREFESQTLANLLSTTQPDSPGYWILIKGIYENSSITDKDKMLELADKFIEQALNPQPAPPDPLVELQKAALQLQATKDATSMAINQQRADNETARMMIEAQKADSNEVRTQSEAILNLAKAESEEAGIQFDTYKRQLQALDLTIGNLEIPNVRRASDRPQEGTGAAAGPLPEGGVAVPPQGIDGAA